MGETYTLCLGTKSDCSEGIRRGKAQMSTRREEGASPVWRQALPRREFFRRCSAIGCVWIGSACVFFGQKSRFSPPRPKAGVLSASLWGSSGLEKSNGRFRKTNCIAKATYERV